MIKISFKCFSSNSALFYCQLLPNRAGSLGSTLACTLIHLNFFALCFFSRCPQNLLRYLLCYGSSVCSYRESAQWWNLTIWMWKRDLQRGPYWVPLRSGSSRPFLSPTKLLWKYAVGGRPKRYRWSSDKNPPVQQERAVQLWYSTLQLHSSKPINLQLWNFSRTLNLVGFCEIDSMDFSSAFKPGQTSRNVVT